MRTYCPWCMSSVTSDGPCPSCHKQPGDYQPSSHHFPIGRLLKGRYLVGRCLGEGGFGITYLGLDTNLERRVAIKEYFPTSFVKRETSVSLDVTCYTDVGRDFYEKGRDQFLLEARTMAKLESIPEIVRVLDFFPENNTAYIVMEFLEGRTLKELVQEQGRIPAKNMLEMLEPVLRAMEAMHREGIIHRDISPDNLMVLKNGKVKLMDFGCARDIEGGKTMTVTLKHGFAPLEQYTGHGQGAWSDVYALCATVYYCLTGKVPPRSVERSDSEQDSLIPPSKLGANLTPSQEKALITGLAVRAKNRWQSASGLYAALYGKTMDGVPWPPKEEPKKEKKTQGKTEYAHSEDDPFRKTEYVDPDDPTPPEDHGTEKKARVPFVGTLLALPRRVKAGIASAACLALVLVAVLTMGRQLSQPIPGEDTKNAPVSGTVKVPEDNSSSSAEEPSEDDIWKLPGIGEAQPGSVDTSADNGSEETPSSSNQDSGSVQGTTPQSTAQQMPPQNTAPTQTATPPTTSGAQGKTNASGSSSGNTSGSSSGTTAPTSPSSGGSTGSQSSSGADKEPETPSKDDLLASAKQKSEAGQYEEAAAIYRQMAKDGLPSTPQLGAYLEDLAGDCKTDDTLMASLYIEAANLGDQYAMVSAGHCYEYGKGVSQSDSSAFSWYLKAAQAGYEWAYYRVGLCYAKGKGVTQNSEEARNWLDKYLASGYATSYETDEINSILENL